MHRCTAPSTFALCGTLLISGRQSKDLSQSRFSVSWKQQHKFYIHLGEKIMHLNDLEKKPHQHKIVRIVKVPDGPNMLVRFLGSSLSFQVYPAATGICNRSYEMCIILLLEAYCLNTAVFLCTYLTFLQAQLF